MKQHKSDTTAQIGKKLLKWYDQNARPMPWRIAPEIRQTGQLPDPYHVWLSEVMLQQTTVATVGPYFESFLKRWPRINDLAMAKDADVMGEWAGLGYYARARNLLKCARVICADLAGEFPKSEAALLHLPGIGPYTAAAIMTIAFDIPATVLDGNIERVMARVFCISAPLPDSKPTLHALAKAATPQARVGDYVQAVMDLGATLCGRRPDCENCPLKDICAARQAGNAAELPAKKPKPARPTRFGIVYFAYSDCGKVLLETRPDKGLLGGMLALPSSEWAQTPPQPDPPFAADWQELPEQVRHIFTHFTLNLTIQIAKTGISNPRRGRLYPLPDPQTLPSVMRKAYKLALKNLPEMAQSGKSSESP